MPGPLKVKDTLPTEVDGKPTQNSYGRPIATNEEGVRNFWKWFGNSKIVDDAGLPMPLYHGTAATFDQFKPGGPEPHMSGPAIWLTPDRERPPAAHNIGWTDRYKEGANVMPLYTSMKKPLVLDDSTRSTGPRRYSLMAPVHSP